MVSCFFDSCGKKMVEKIGPLSYLGLYWYSNFSHHHVIGTPLNALSLSPISSCKNLKTSLYLVSCFLKTVVKQCVKMHSPLLRPAIVPQFLTPLCWPGFTHTAFLLSLESVCHHFKTCGYMVLCFKKSLEKWVVKMVHSFFLRHSTVPQVLTPLCWVGSAHGALCFSLESSF